MIHAVGSASFALFVLVRVSIVGAGADSNRSFKAHHIKAQEHARNTLADMAAKKNRAELTETAV